MNRLIRFFLAGLVAVGLMSPFLSYAEPGDVLDHIDAAKSYMERKQWEYASYEWRTALQQDPRNAQAILGLADSLMQSAMPAEAISHLQAHKAALPVADYNLSLARANEQLQQVAEASALYRQTVQADPHRLEAYAGLKRVKGKLPKAQQADVNRLLNETAAKAKAEAHAALKSGRYEDAVSQYEVLTAINSTVATVNDHGLALLLAGNPQQAAQRFNRLTGKGQCEVKANAAIVALGVGQSEQAVKLMEDTLSSCKNPQIKGKLYNNLGYIYETAGKPTRARFAYEKAVQANPGDLKAKMNLGYIHQRNRDYEQAIATYESILAANPNYGEAWNRMGFAYEMSRKQKKALEAYQKAIAVSPGLKDAYYNLGALYKKMGKTEKAMEAYKQLTDQEFSALEQGKQTASSAPASELFNYIDLFFSEPVL